MSSPVDVPVPAPSTRRKSSLLKSTTLSRLTADRAKEVEDRLLKRIKAVLLIQRYMRKYAPILSNRPKTDQRVHTTANDAVDDGRVRNIIPSNRKIDLGDFILSCILKQRIDRIWSSKFFSSVVTTWKDTYGILLDCLLLTNKRDICVQPTSKNPKKMSGKKAVIKPVFDSVDQFTNFLLQINTNSGTYGSPIGNVNSEEAMVLLKETYKFEYSLALQYIQSKYAFHQKLFSQAVWRPLNLLNVRTGPARSRYCGFWDFSEALKLCPPLPVSSQLAAEKSPRNGISSFNFFSAATSISSSSTAAAPVTSSTTVDSSSVAPPHSPSIASPSHRVRGFEASATATPPEESIIVATDSPSNEAANSNSNCMGSASMGDGDRNQKMALLRQHIQQMKPPSASSSSSNDILDSGNKPTRSYYADKQSVKGESERVVGAEASASTEKTSPALKFSNSLRSSLQASSASQAGAASVVASAALFSGGAPSAAVAVAGALRDIRDSARHPAHSFHSPSRQPHNQRDHRWSLQRSRSVERSSFATPDRGGGGGSSSTARSPRASTPTQGRGAAGTGTAVSKGASKLKPPLSGASPSISSSLSASLSNNRVLRRSKSCLRDSFGSRVSFAEDGLPLPLFSSPAGSAQSTRSNRSLSGDDGGDNGTWHTVPSAYPTPSQSQTPSGVQSPRSLSLSRSRSPAKRFMSPSALRRMSSSSASGGVGSGNPSGGNVSASSRIPSHSYSGSRVIGSAERSQVARDLAHEYELAGAEAGAGTQKRQIQMNSLVQSLDQLTNELIMNNNSIQHSQMLRKQRMSATGIQKSVNSMSNGGIDASAAKETQLADAASLGDKIVATTAASPIPDSGTPDTENRPKIKVKSQPSIKQFFSVSTRQRPDVEASGATATVSTSTRSPSARVPISLTPQPNDKPVACTSDTGGSPHYVLPGGKSPMREPPRRTASPRVPMPNRRAAGSAENVESSVRSSLIPNPSPSEPVTAATSNSAVVGGVTLAGSTAAQASSHSPAVGASKSQAGSPSLVAGRKKISPSKTGTGGVSGSSQVTPPPPASQQQSLLQQASAQRSIENRALRNRLLSIYNSTKLPTPPQKVSGDVSAPVVTPTATSKSHSATSSGRKRGGASANSSGSNSANNSARTSPSTTTSTSREFPLGEQIPEVECTPAPLPLDQQQAKVQAEAKAQRSAENRALRNKLQFKSRSKKPDIASPAASSSANSSPSVVSPPVVVVDIPVAPTFIKKREELLPSPTHTPESVSAATVEPSSRSSESAGLLSQINGQGEQEQMLDASVCGYLHPETASEVIATAEAGTTPVKRSALITPSIPVTPSVALNTDISNYMEVDSPPAILSRYEMLLQQRGMHKVGGSVTKSPARSSPPVISPHIQEQSNSSMPQAQSPKRSPVRGAGSRSPFRQQQMGIATRSPKLGKSPARSRIGGTSDDVGGVNACWRMPPESLSDRESWKDFVDSIDIVADHNVTPMDRPAAAEVEIELDCASAPSSSARTRAPSATASVSVTRSGPRSSMPSTPSPPPVPEQEGPLSPIHHFELPQTPPTRSTTNSRSNSVSRSNSKSPRVGGISPLREKQDLVNAALKRLSNSQASDISIHDIVSRQVL